MLVLAFDTASAAVTVALYEWVPGEGAGRRATVDARDGRRHGEQLTPAIAGVLAEAGVRPADLSAVAVGVGPGPYTGLRVGLVTARALGAALKIPVHGVCTLDAIAWASGRTGPFVVATDARRREVYWARYACARERVTEPAVGPAGSVLAEPGELPVIGEGAALYPDALGAGDPSPLLPSAQALAELAVERLAGTDSHPLLPPEPLYLRRPDTAAPSPRKQVTQR